MLNDAEKKSIAKAREYLIKRGICARDGSGESNVEALFLRIHRLDSELVGLTAEQCLHLLDDSIGRDQYAIAVWHIEDVESLAQERDKKLTQKQAKEVIKRVDKHQDAEFGISWDTLDAWIDIVLAEAKAGR